MDITKIISRENTSKKIKPREDGKASSASNEKVEEKKNFESLLKETKEVPKDRESNINQNEEASKKNNDVEIAKLEEDLTPENKQILSEFINLIKLNDEASLENLDGAKLGGDENGDLAEILILLLALMQGNLDKKTIETLDKNEGVKAIGDLLVKNEGFGELVKDAKNFDVSNEESKGKLNDVLTKLVSELKETPNEEVSDKLLNFLKEITTGEGKETEAIVKDIKNELKNILKSEANDDVNSKGEARLETIVVDKTKVNSQSASSEGQSSKGDKENFKSDKEEKFLKSLTGEEEKNSKPFALNNFKTSFPRVDSLKEAPVITKNNAVFDMIKTVKYMNTNALKELTVKIYPKELGEITISISQEQDVMKANIKANSKDAYQLLSNSLNEIKKTLGEQNIKIQEVNIGLYNDDTTFHREGQENREHLYSEEMKNKSNVNGEYLEGVEEVEIEKVYKGNVNMLA